MIPWIAAGLAAAAGVIAVLILRAQLRGARAERDLAQRDQRLATTELAATRARAADEAGRIEAVVNQQRERAERAQEEAIERATKDPDALADLIDGAGARGSTPVVRPAPPVRPDRMGMLSRSTAGSEVPPAGDVLLGQPSADGKGVGDRAKR